MLVLQIVFTHLIKMLQAQVVLLVSQFQRPAIVAMQIEFVAALCKFNRTLGHA